MIEQLKTIRDGLENFTEPYLQKALTALDQLEAMVGAQEPVAWGLIDEGAERARGVATSQKEGWEPLYRIAPVAQQPLPCDSPCGNVKCAVGCKNHVAQQPQAEAVPAVDRVYEAAKRLVDHADFQLGGVLSAKSKARDIPSNAASKVKARHLASLRDALAKTPQQAEAVPDGWYITERRDGGTAKQWPLTEQQTLAVALPQQAEAVPPTHVLVPIDVLEAASESLGSFVSDNGWTDLDMQAMDNLDAILAQQKGGV